LFVGFNDRLNFTFKSLDLQGKPLQQEETISYAISDFNIEFELICDDRQGEKFTFLATHRIIH